jgi:hypothetical protein
VLHSLGYEVVFELRVHRRRSLVPPI